MAFLDLRFRFLTVSANALAVVAILGSAVLPMPALAEQEEGLPPTPLELAEPDPLIPEAVWEGEAELTAQERQTLIRAVASLEERARTALDLGNPNEAFALWNRALRLRRFVGVRAELLGLLQVGRLAWEQENFYQAQVIRERLREIQTEQLTEDDRTADLAVLQTLAESYEAVGARQAALALYERLLGVARAQNDPISEEAILRQIASIALRDLDYEEAAAAHRELRDMAIERGDRVSEIYYVTQLAYIYDQLRWYEEAIAVKRDLELYYWGLNDIAQVTALKIAIGEDYAALGQLNTAIEEFQEAYRLAWEALQFYRAQEALERLASLYERYNELDAALQVYRTQIDVHQLARNLYGLMTTYDRIARVYQRQQNYGAALEAFRQGLALARQIGAREAYFQIHIDEVVQQMSPISPPQR